MKNGGRRGCEESSCGYAGGVLLWWGGWKTYLHEEAFTLTSVFVRSRLLAEGGRDFSPGDNPRQRPETASIFLPRRPSEGTTEQKRKGKRSRSYEKRR